MSVEGKTNDWRTPIHKQLRMLNITKETRGFYLLNGQMFKKSNDGLLMKCVREKEGKEKAEQLHEATCGEEGPGLYQRLQRRGIYWPKMKSHCDELQTSCKACQETKESTQICDELEFQFQKASLSRANVYVIFFCKHPAMHEKNCISNHTLKSCE
ncbi:hypothetical protein Ahy_A06g026217 [Arachis hypogaea]|uniref:Integrase zinc-binding domain-containing protein n=1 Tax=Arachis hypogaea TaxID=3818 RepID=A0A445CJU4_ARAHY|nr:hypothetical protein Ahy_A06g026217 [Arachis hypogaea]